MILELDDVSVRYDGTTALRDLSFTVEDGEFFSLVGPSGCGKTTTLRVLAGFDEPSGGTVHFDGREMTGIPPEARDIGLVFQNYALFPHMTVGENIAYGLQFRSPDGDRADRVAELLELVGLAGFEDRDPTTLSGGQQQRVALARALAPDPALLLLDEPMSALDARLRGRLRRDVREIQQSLGVTTVYVTHDQAEALAISDRVGVMNAGRIEQIGRPEVLYRRPASRFVATFLGENNVFEGRVAGDASAFAATGNDMSSRSDETEGVVVRVGPTEVLLAGRDTPADGPVTFCVRPGDLRVDADTNRLEGTVRHVEFRGETVRVFLGWEDRELVVTTDHRPRRDTLTVGFDPDDVWVVPH